MSSAFSDQPEAPGRMNTGWRLLTFMGGGMLAGILFLSWLGTPRIIPAVGQSLSRVELTPLAFTDRRVSEADLRDKVTLIHFWGTWCPHCMTEFPEFTEVATELQKRGDIQVLSVACSEGPEYNLEGLTSEIRDYLQKQSVELPTYADPAGLTRGQVALLLPDNALAYPCTLVIDQAGIIQGAWTGYKPGSMEQAKQKAMSLVKSSDSKS